jgi:hypothetical protein
VLSGDVLPAVAGSAFVMCLFLLLGRWAGALGAAFAVTLAFFWANFSSAVLLDFEAEPTWENTYRLMKWKPDERNKLVDWLPRAALVLVVVGLLSRWVGLLAGRFLPEKHRWGANLLVWSPRIAAVVVVSGWLVLEPAAAAPEWKYLRYQLAAVMLVSWVALDAVARAEAGAEIAFQLAAMFFAAAILLLHVSYLSIVHISVIFTFALLGIAIVAALGGSDTSGAIPAAVVFLPGLILATRPSLSDHAVKAHCFWMIALTPLVLLPFAIPAVARKTTWDMTVLRCVLVLAPLVAAIVIAQQHAQLAYE